MGDYFRCRWCGDELRSNELSYGIIGLQTSLLFDPSDYRSPFRISHDCLTELLKLNTSKTHGFQWSAVGSRIDVGLLQALEEMERRGLAHENRPKEYKRIKLYDDHGCVQFTQGDDGK